MAKPDSERELTSTLHLGLRSVVGNSPADMIAELLSKATDQEREIIEGVMSTEGDSAMIFIHRGAQKGARFLINSEMVAIGRSPDNAIFLDDVTVSRKHAQISKSGSNYTFADLGSLNGSYVNNESVAEKVLRSGDEIQIGKFHLLFISSSVVGEK